MPSDFAETGEKVEETLAEVKVFFLGLTGEDILRLLYFALKIVAIFVICLLVKRILLASLSKILGKTRMEKGLQSFLHALVNVILWLVLVIVMALVLNIDITPMIAAFSIIGLALSLAVQDSLANLAGGMNILMSRPFVVGDYIEIDQDGGTVFSIGMIHTTLQTVDNRRIMLPNSKVMSARVINYSSEQRRRVDLSFSASYDAPIPAVQEAILTMLEGEGRILTDEFPCEVLVKLYGDSSIEYVLRAWCAQEDYWGLCYDLRSRIKPALDVAGIEMSYPHLNVHLQDKRQ